jgi:hypothetical protein
MNIVETDNFEIIDLGLQELDVYDIEVDGVHNFFANGILVHNSLYCSLSEIIPPNANPNLVVKIADKIGHEINASFPAYNRSAFLVQPGFDQHIKTGRELVADKGFFIQKKRYVIHVIDKEGKAKDELKAMGVDMRKTTTPRPVKAFLRSTCHKMLTGTPDEELDDFIMEYRDEMIDEIDLMDLGLPKGIKGIEQYTASFRDYPTTRLPGHVSAAILYNDFRQAAGDTESLLISSGMKIKIFKLKYEMEHAGRMFKAIAVPTDEEMIPQWFKDEFFDKIDRQRHVGMLVDNMLHNMFDSIPRQVPTRQSKAYESDFSF